MKSLIYILSFTLFLFGCENKKKNETSQNDDWQQAEIAFKELKETLKIEKGKTWNYSLEGAVMLVNRKTRTIIANESDGFGNLTKRKNIFIGKLPDNIHIANTAFNWNGKDWSIIALPLPKTKEKRLNLLVHESYHRIQPKIGFDSLCAIQNKHLNSKNGRIYLKLELNALKKALSSEESEIHIKNALQFRWYRHQLFPNSKNAENSLEINEGLAEYTGSILSQRQDSELRKHYISQIDWFYTLPTFVRSFPYFTIPVYGYFMQKIDEKWNLQITKNTNLTDFISNFWKMETNELTEKDILELGKEYEITSIIKKETQRENKIIELKNKYKKMFLGDSIVEIELKKVNIAFNPSNIMPLDAMGTVYPNLRVTDDWGILDVDSCGALISSKRNKVIISRPNLVTDSVITGEGWKLKLKKTWKLDFIDNKYQVTKK